jgi:hypothetical protein
MTMVAGFVRLRGSVLEGVARSQLDLVSLEARAGCHTSARGIDREGREPANQVRGAREDACVKPAMTRHLAQSVIAGSGGVYGLNWSRVYYF